MATITKGQTFGVSEQITNVKLHALVDSATIAGILASEFSNNILTSLASASGKIPPQNLWEYKSVATNASVPSLAVGTVFKLNSSTYGSIASFSNARTGQKFTLIAGQASYPCILDSGAFLLSANWMAAKAGDNLTLVWDGTNFIEVGRTAV
jgi:hypothetical protein